MHKSSPLMLSLEWFSSIFGINFGNEIIYKQLGNESRNNMGMKRQSIHDFTILHTHDNDWEQQTIDLRHTEISMIS